MNRYSKALKHIKSTQIEEKIKKLEESTPTNNTDNLYSTNPQGFNDGPPDPAKVFYPDQDGDWPSGIPGDEDAASYLRPPGFWTGEVNWDTIHTANVSQDEIGSDGKSTAGVIADDGTVKTVLPENTRDFILGPLVDGYVPNHTHDAYCNIGYIQKDTRQFVLLGRITGVWKAGIHGATCDAWDGGADGFTSYNENFTLAHAQWFQAEVVANNYVTNAPYFYSGGVPQQNLDSDQCPTCPSGMKGGVLPGGGGGGNSASGDSGGAGWGTGGTPDIGDRRSPGTSGNAGDVGLWGLVYDNIKGKADEFIDDLKSGVKGAPKKLVNAAINAGLIQGFVAPAWKTLTNHQDNNDPTSKTFRNNDPTSSNYKGPKNVTSSFSSTQQSQITAQANHVLSMLNGGKGPSNPNGTLTPSEIEDFSANMNYPSGSYQSPGYSDDSKKAFNNTFHSLPVNTTTVNLQNGKLKNFDSNYQFSDPRDASVTGDFTGASEVIHGVTQQAVNNGVWKPGDDGEPYYKYSVDTHGRGPDNPIIGTQYNTQVKFSSTPSNTNKKSGQASRGTSNKEQNEPQGQVISESRKIKILREVKKPYKMPEIPKQKYKMNFSGKYSAQNTPDKTASKVTDALIASGNDKGHRWRTQDKYWQGYETTERMNIVYDKLGHSEQAWNMITEKNGWKDREIQEHLNILAHEKQMLKENPLYESPFYTKMEPQSYEKDPLYKKVKDKLNKELHYKDRPSVKGYPNEPPPEMVNGWHPKFGKRYKYDKLDPQSAEAMPDTGDPEIDANIEKATDKKAKTRKSKVLAGKTEQFSNWRDDLTDA